MIRWRWPIDLNVSWPPQYRYESDRLLVGMLPLWRRPVQNDRNYVASLWVGVVAVITLLYCSPARADARVILLRGWFGPVQRWPRPAQDKDRHWMRQR